jgi:hypothetical protein
MESATGTREGHVRSEIQKENYLEIENCFVLFFFFKCSGSHRVSFALYNFFSFCVIFSLLLFTVLYMWSISFNLVVTAARMARGHTGTGLLAVCLRLKLVK